MAEPIKQKRYFPLLSGLARGLTADVIGGPVDLATILLNSGLAAYGYAGNKLGLLKPSEMPDLLENPVGGSDWFAGKNTPLTDDGSARFMAGRLTGNLAPSLPGAARSLVPKAKPGQVNSLLGGLAGDDPGLFLSHGGHIDSLVTPNGGLVRELYNPSFAVTRDKLSTFSGANTVLVPWPGKLDPKNAKTLLTATDSYNPRWHASRAARFDNLPSDVDLKKGLADPRTAEFINQRLFEKLGNPFSKQGIKQEGSATAPRGELPRLGQGLAAYQERWNPVDNSLDTFAHRVAMSPRFQSLESFVNSPHGGRLIGNKSGQDAVYAVESATEKLLSALFRPTRAGGLEDLASTYAPKVKHLKALASDTAPRDLLSRKKSETFLDTLQIRDPETNAFRPMTSDEKIQIRQTAGKLLTQLKTAPSDYAELKSYGPWQVSQDNVAGIVGRKNYNDMRLAEAAKKRGIPYEPVDNAADEVAAADWFLKRKGKTSILQRGLAQDPPQPSPQLSSISTEKPDAKELIDIDAEFAKKLDDGANALIAKQPSLAKPAASFDAFKADWENHYSKNGFYKGFNDLQGLYPDLSDNQLWALSDVYWHHGKSAKATAAEKAAAIAEFQKLLGQK